MSQFRLNNRPTLLDLMWNLVSLVRFRKHHSVFFELGAYLYRNHKRVYLGHNVYLKRNSIVGCANLNAEVAIGENTTVGFSTIIISSLKINIGSNCMIAPHVYIVDSNHGMAHDKPFNQQANHTDPVVIEDNVWIGTHSVILPGVLIKSGVIVGANSTVTSSLLERGVYGGTPAKRIK